MPSEQKVNQAQADDALIALNEELVALHEQGKSSEQIVRSSSEAWDLIQRCPRSRYGGAICQWIKLAYYRLAKSEEKAAAGAGDEHWAHGDLWKSRELAAHTLAGYQRGVANVLMSEALASLWEYGDLSSAHGILDATLMLVMNTKSDEVYPDALMHRLYHEKRGFCLWWVKEYSEAVDEYEEALPFALEEDEIFANQRAKLKVTGGWALARYFSDPEGRGGQDAIEKAKWILAKAEDDSRIAGIYQDTKRNLALMQNACVDREKFRLYDII